MNLENYLEERVDFTQKVCNPDRYGVSFSLLEVDSDEKYRVELSVDSQACYSNLWGYGGEGCLSNYRLFIFPPPPLEKSNYDDFILNRSCFSHVFITKTMENGYIEVDTKLGFYEILSALSALRLPTEQYSPNRGFFDKLVSGGLTEKQAFLLYHCTYLTHPKNKINLIANEDYYFMGGWKHNHYVFNLKEHGILGFSNLEKYSPTYSVQTSWRKYFHLDEENKNFLKDFQKIFDSCGTKEVYRDIFGVKQTKVRVKLKSLLENIDKFIKVMEKV